MHDLTFDSWPKIHRLTGQTIITEKIDGTNAQIFIVPLASEDDVPPGAVYVSVHDHVGNATAVLAGSRKRWITPQDDNFGFAQWVQDNAEELVKLGPGRHYEEWWGSGIQRGYGLEKGEKRFSLFNVGRWDPYFGAWIPGADENPLPECVYLVPLLAVLDRFNTQAIDEVIHELHLGSHAAPGFPDPEGVVVEHRPSRMRFKVTDK